MHAELFWSISDVHTDSAIILIEQPRDISIRWLSMNVSINTQPYYFTCYNTSHTSTSNLETNDHEPQTGLSSCQMLRWISNHHNQLYHIHTSRFSLSSEVLVIAFRRKPKRQSSGNGRGIFALRQNSILISGITIVRLLGDISRVSVSVSAVRFCGGL